MRKRELSHEGRLTIKSLRGNGHSFPQIATVARCDHFTCIKIFNSFKKLAQFIKKQRSGRRNKISDRGKDICAELQGRYDLAD